MADIRALRRAVRHETARRDVRRHTRTTQGAQPSPSVTPRSPGGGNREVEGRPACHRIGDLRPTPDQILCATLGSKEEVVPREENLAVQGSLVMGAAGFEPADRDHPGCDAACRSGFRSLKGLSFLRVGPRTGPRSERLREEVALVARRGVVRVPMRVVKHECFALRRQRERHSPGTDDGRVHDGRRRRRSSRAA
jgi:hypothetical protein